MVSVILAFMVLLTGCGQMNHGGTAAPSLTAGTEKQEPQITGHTDSSPEPQTTGHSDSSPESRTTALWDSDALMKDLYTEALPAAYILILAAHISFRQMQWLTMRKP